MSATNKNNFLQELGVSQIWQNMGVSTRSPSTNSYSSSSSSSFSSSYASNSPIYTNTQQYNASTKVQIQHASGNCIIYGHANSGFKH
jgi:hypothetical protein